MTARVKTRRSGQPEGPSSTARAATATPLREALTRPAPGRPLDARTRGTMEAGFDHRFEDVRVHHDAAADALARDVHALAFTYGQDVYFRDGAYDPASASGQRLLAHELTHVVQQDAAGAAGATEELTVSAPVSAAEREAATAAESVAAGGAAEVSVAAAPAVQRFWNPLEEAGNWLGDQAYGIFGEHTDKNGANPALGAGVDMAKAGATGIGTVQKIANFLTSDLVPDGAGGMMENENPLLGKGSAMGTALSAAGAGLDFLGNIAEGQGVGESAGGAAGGFLGSKLMPSAGPVDTAINVANTGLKAAGAPQGVTDVSSLVASGTASSFGSGVFSNLGRGLYNWASGDDKALDKQFTDIESGKSGAALQGYAMLPQVLAGVFGTDEDFDTTIMKVGSKGQDSSAARVGNWLGDTAYQFINKDLPEAAEFAAKDDSTTGKMMNWLLN